MYITDRVKDILSAVDLIAARLREPLHKLTLILIAAQGVYAAGGFAGVIPSDSKATKWIAVGSSLIALYTMRKGEAHALLQAKRKESQELPILDVKP